MKKLLVVLVLCLLSAGIAPAGWAKPKTYLAVGDSYAFGYTSDNPDDPHAIVGRSFGAPGYVHAYARTLDPRSSSRNALKVVNVSIPGETTATFYTGGSPGGLANLHYFFDPNSPFPYPTNAVSQYQTLLSKIQQEHAERRDVYRITIQLGGNDLQSLLSDPAFVFGDDQTRFLMASEVLTDVQLNYATLLVTLKQAAPEARLILVGYVNPFRPLADPPISHPAFQGLDPLIQGLNGVIAGLAAQFGAQYVDLFTPFIGHEAQWTYILDPFGSPSPVPGAPRLPNVHPTIEGYAAIADLLAAQEKRIKD